LTHYLKLSEQQYGYNITVTVPEGTDPTLVSMVTTYDYRKHNGCVMRHVEGEKQVFLQHRELTGKALEGAAARAAGGELVKVKKEKPQDVVLKAKAVELVKLKNAFSAVANSFRERTEDMRGDPEADTLQLNDWEEKVKVQTQVLQDTRACIAEALLKNKITTHTTHCGLQLAATKKKK
jgi:hypothetical protein